MDESRKKKKEVDPAPALLMVLVRNLRGWYEKVELAHALGVSPSVITMWERRTRAIPRWRLEQLFDVAGFPRALITPSLRTLRSLTRAAQGRSRADRPFEIAVAASTLPLILTAADLILEPLFPSGEAVVRDDPQDQWESLKRRTQEERLLLVEEGEELQTRELAELIAAESAAHSMENPREAAEWADLARRVGELAPE